MAILGGTRSLVGPALAAALLTMVSYPDIVLPGLSRDALTIVQDWEADVYALVIILVMLFLPDGISGSGRRLLDRLGRGRLRSDAESGGGDVA